MTTGTSSTTSVTVTTLVEASPTRAFEVFTAEIGTWWSPDHHILEAKLKEMVFEPFVGGHVYDVGTDGSECRWARVLAYDPPRELAFSWDISLAWQIEADPTRASEVWVTFAEEAPDRTRVTLQHRHLDRHGEGWEQMRDAVGAPDGWGKGLADFAVVAGTAR